MAKKSEATTEAKSVATTEEAALPIAVADLELLSGQGFENADKDAYAIPFLRILQTGSPQVNEDEPSYIEGAKPGMFFNTITGALYGKELKVIPIAYSRSFIEWQQNRGGFIKDHGPDPKILDRIETIDDKHNSILDNGNVIQDARTHIVLLADSPASGPIILSMTSTGIKHSRKWMTLMNGVLIPNSTKQAPMFATVWKIGTVRNENDDGKWYQVGDKTSTNINMDGWVTKDQLDAAVRCRDMVASGDAKADWDSTVDKPGQGGSQPAYNNHGEEVDPITGKSKIPF